MHNSPVYDPSSLFRNIDYTGMSVDDLKQRSARRVKRVDSDTEIFDITWTEVKLRLIAEIQDKVPLTPLSLPKAKTPGRKSERLAKKRTLKRKQPMSEHKGKRMKLPKPFSLN